MVEFKVADTLTQKFNRILQFAGIGVPILELLNLFKSFEIELRYRCRGIGTVKTLQSRRISALIVQLNA